MNTVNTARCTLQDLTMSSEIANSIIHGIKALKWHTPLLEEPLIIISMKIILFIMQEFMDSVEFCSGKGGMAVKMIKRLDPKGG